jgi:hypothetical protein
LRSFEENVILNLALACGHLCCKFPRASVIYLLKHYNQKKYLFFNNTLLQRKNSVDPRVFSWVLNTYWHILKQLPVLLSTTNLKTKFSPESLVFTKTPKEPKQSIFDQINDIFNLYKSFMGLWDFLNKS